jgi:hypothetical protein
MAQQQPIQIAGRTEGNCKALIGRCNRLFPGFHGTTEQMGKLWDALLSELQRMDGLRAPDESSRQYSISLAVRDVSTDHLQLDVDDLEPSKEQYAPFTLMCEVSLGHHIFDGTEQMEVRVITRPSHIFQHQLPCGKHMRRFVPIAVGADDKHQQLKQRLASVAKYMANYRPCKAPRFYGHLEARGVRCGKPCVEGEDLCVGHWVGLPMQRDIDDRAAKRQRAQ